MVDMHTHSTKSDGTFSPSELIYYAKEKKLRAIALTDHDNINGLKEAEDLASKIGIEFIKGIEYSCNIGKNEVHILGYFLNLDDKKFLDETNELLKTRENRNISMIEKLQHLGFDIDYQNIKQENIGIIGRVHIANELVKKKYFTDIKEVFDKLLSKNGLAYVERENTPPHIAVEILKDNGAFISLAHPMLYSKNYQEIEILVKELKNIGLDAIELFHTSANKKDIEKLKIIAKRYNLLITGGSDFHGANKKNIDLACRTISDEQFLKIKKYMNLR